MRADAVEKRAAILDAARSLLAEKGPEVSLRAVAAAAGVGIATLYRHFPTREDLIIGVANQMVDQVTELMEQCREGWSTQEEAEQTWHNFAHGISRLKWGSVAERTMAVVPTDGAVWEATEPLRQRLHAGFAAIIVQASSFGLVDAELSPWRFQFGLAAISRPLPDRVEMFAPKESEWLVDIYLRGLRQH